MGLLSAVKHCRQHLRGYTTYSMKSGGVSPGSQSYYVAFEGQPWRKSSHSVVYKGIRCACASAACSCKVVVKCPRCPKCPKCPHTGDGDEEEEACQQVVCKASRVQQLANAFQAAMSTHLSVRLSVEVPLVAEVSEASFPGPHHVLVEKRLPGDFVQLTDDIGRSLDPSYDVLEKFSSYVYHVTGGREMIGSLHGRYLGNNTFHLVSPSLHSVARSYGPFDQGQDAVRHFHDVHHCTEACWEFLGIPTPTAPPCDTNVQCICRVTDCNGNGSDYDWNGNGSAYDCNGNGSAYDCNGNGSDYDCNGNGCD